MKSYFSILFTALSISLLALGFEDLPASASIRFTAQIPPIYDETLQDLIFNSKWLDPEEFGVSQASSFADTKKAGERISRAIVQLKSFINDSLFDEARFDTASENLATDLSQIEQLAGGPVDKDTVLGKQLIYARFVFETMVDASLALKLYESVPTPENILLSRMFHLNVKILALFNDQGSIDTTIERYEQTVTGFWKNILFCKHTFFSLTGISVDDRLVFRSQVNQAVAVISILWKQVGREKRYT
ncbi:hypothetical protein JCM33374_g4221 [Metschnikowia sp. JCM 33374]|nr:hypothetical protein JCM33374_g4221 [Metschnikowia sp. JCM 33374]